MRREVLTFMYFKEQTQGLLALSVLRACLLPATVWSHGGASVDNDPCPVPIRPHLDPSLRINQNRPAQSTISQPGPAVWVFDYQGKA